MVEFLYYNKKGLERDSKLKIGLGIFNLQKMDSNSQKKYEEYVANELSNFDPFEPYMRQMITKRMHPHYRHYECLGRRRAVVYVDKEYFHVYKRYAHKNFLDRRAWRLRFFPGLKGLQLRDPLAYQKLMMAYKICKEDRNLQTRIIISKNDASFCDRDPYDRYDVMYQLEVEWANPKAYKTHILS